MALCRAILRRRAVLRARSFSASAFPERSLVSSRVSDLLASFGRTGTEGYTVPADGSLLDAIEVIVRRRVPLVIAVDGDSFVGVMTARDVLRALYETRGNGDGPLGSPLRKHVTPAERVVTASPDDSLAQVSVIMSEARVRSLPVVESGRDGTSVAGVVLLKDITDFLHASQTGDKKSFSRYVLDRRGLGHGARASPASPTGLSDGDSDASQTKDEEGSVRERWGGGERPGRLTPTPLPARGDGRWLQLRVGAACEARKVRPPQPPPAIEDAHFVARVSWPADAEVSSPARRDGGHARGAAEGGGALAPLTYLGVFDGVGSWVGRGVDPTAFSGAMRDAAVEAVTLAPQGFFGPHGGAGKGEGGAGSGLGGGLVPPSPLEVLEASWSRVMSERVIGSSTALLASLDPLSGQLAVANVGDCGVLVVRPGLHGEEGRRVGSLVAGAAASMAGGHDGRLAIAFRSAQQLKDFNFPFQLGFSPREDDASVSQDVFESPAQAEFMRVPLAPNDIVIAASDGLFDNVEAEAILGVVGQWLDDDGLTRAAEDTEELDAYAPPHPNTVAHGDSDVMAGLAQALVDLAVERSMDRSRDSPFALLAKDNDILWSGGIADDVTVVVGLVTEDVWPPRH